MTMEIVNSFNQSQSVSPAVLLKTQGPANPFDLEAKVNELRKLCQEIDPYSPLSEDDIKLLAKYHIYDCFDPFALTNKLILALEDALEEWHRSTNTPLD